MCHLSVARSRARTYATKNRRCAVHSSQPAAAVTPSTLIPPFPRSAVAHNPNTDPLPANPGRSRPNSKEPRQRKSSTAEQARLIRNHERQQSKSTKDLGACGRRSYGCDTLDRMVLISLMMLWSALMLLIICSCENPTQKVGVIWCLFFCR